MAAGRARARKLGELPRLVYRVCLSSRERVVIVVGEQEGDVPAAAGSLT
jgi:hypothetical protein